MLTNRPQKLLPAPSVPVLVSTLAINILALAIPLFSIQIYDRIIVQQGRATLYVLGAGVAVALLLELALRLLRSRLIGQAAALTEARLSARAFAALTGTSLMRLQRATQGQLLQAFQAIGRLREFHGGQAFVTLLELPFAALYLVGVAYLGGVLVAVPLALLGLFALRAWQLGRALRGALTARQRADRQRYDFLAETLAGIHTIKACGAEQRQLRRYEALQQQLDRSNYRAVAISNLSSGDGALFGQLMLATITLAGAWLAGGGWEGHRLTLGALIACVLLSGRAMQPVQRTLGLWHRFQDGELALRRLETLSALAPLESAAVALPAGGPLAIDLKNISYTYPAQPTLLHTVSWQVAAGATVSLTGPAGSGKSTLLRILCGLYAPDQGQVRLGGRPFDQWPLAQLPPGVVYLRQQDGAQDGALRGTVADNLTRAGQVSLAAVLPLVRLLDLESDIARLPHGYATTLSGTAADAVPPGFKQRLALARALALPDGAAPRLVIFDGADRGLDVRGYSALLALLGRLQGSATLVLATADANLRALAARHYRLDQGNLVEIANSAGIPATLRQPSLASHGGLTL